uniref:Uncharacterized protein n=1 Tax=Plectus sambesii TaxID=2011161 RepID=A0A914V985_9BILA
MLRLAFLTKMFALLAIAVAQQYTPQVCEFYRTRGIALSGCNNIAMPMPLPPTPSPSGLNCNNVFCAANSQCVSGRCVPLGNNPTPATMPPLSCAYMLCASGTTCVEGRGCVQNGNNPAIATMPPLSCATMLCVTGTTCIEGRGCVQNGYGGTVKCLENEQFMQCSSCENICGQQNMACPAVCGPAKCQCSGSYARDRNSGRCVPQLQCPMNNSNTGNVGGCSMMRCAAGQQCVEQQVTCVRAPCPPRASCVPVTNNNNGNGVGSCAARMCPANQRCVEQMVMCINPPCGTTSSCVPIQFAG